MSTRRMKKVNNFELEVESICSHNENNENIKSTKTPQTRKILNDTTPKRKSEVVLQDLIQTPRRSCRKSAFKPSLDYDDIVKRSLRSCTRSGKKVLLAEGENDENTDHANVHPRWTPAKVGRVSQKRGRKSKRVEKGKNQIDKNTEKVPNDTYGIKEESQGNNVLEKALDCSEMLEPLVEDLKETKHIKEQMEDVIYNMQCMDTAHDNSKKPEVEENRNSLVQNDANIKIHNQSVQLLQDDSEDELESTEKSEPEEICIIYENNISNEKETQSESPKSIKSVNKEDAFGSYLKCKEINISDLGLNPISHEEDNDETNFGKQIKTVPNETEEMSSLIIYDDIKQTRKMNETFEADEKVEIKNCPKQDEEIMEILQISDDESETPKKCPETELIDTNKQTRAFVTDIPSIVKVSAVKLLSTAKQPINGSAIKAKLPLTPKTLTPKFPRTPQQSKIQYRRPTPYRKRNFKVNDETKENIQKTPNKASEKISVGYLTTLEPREIVLREIRKRSLSVSVNEQHCENLLVKTIGKQKQNRMVSFHSPANQTTIIDDLDVVIAKSLKKRKVQEKQISGTFVTTRHKRSLSFDESLMSSSIASKLPRPVLNQTEASKTKNMIPSKSSKRTKLPNFAAIHEKNFNKMENLVDHVSRKQERSKNLINSATKLMSASAQKNLSLDKSMNNKTSEKPRALKKIDLKQNLKKIPNSDLRKKPAMQQKPAFNLSTSVIVKPIASTSNFVEKASTSRLCNDKTDSRLQRHMELFKGRAASSRTGTISRKNEVILKGVRSNRRFELQMQHRKNLEQ